jgi:hypothetical protein
VTDERWPDLSGGYRYLALARMSYYVNKDVYRAAVRTVIAALRGAKPVGRGAFAGRILPARRP